MSFVRNGFQQKSGSKQFPRRIAAQILKIGLLRSLIDLLTAARYIVQGDSMMPNLADGQGTLASRLAYRLKAPARGDVVVLRHPHRQGRTYIKRIVGLPGEHVEVREGHVCIDGAMLPDLGRPDHRSLAAGAEASLPEGFFTQSHNLGEGQYFVVGDNLEASDDSRTFGPVDRKMITGKAWIRCWPRKCWKVFT